MRLFAVFDTNVLVSALISPGKTCHSALSIVRQGDVDPLLDDRILAEYRLVLKRPELSMNSFDAEETLVLLLAAAHWVKAESWTGVMPDPNDRPFFEVAVSGNADFLVTGDKKGWPKVPKNTFKLVSPREFLDLYEGR